MSDKLETPEDWWQLTDKHWSNILEIFSLTGAPMGREDLMYPSPDNPYGGPILHTKSLMHTLEDLKALRTIESGKELARWFNLTWMAAPDKPHIHTWPSWHVLCDLCSEAWVFEPQEIACSHLPN